MPKGMVADSLYVIRSSVEGLGSKDLRLSPFPTFFNVWALELMAFKW